jgi:tryptophan 2,3-dioxygenase
VTGASFGEEGGRLSYGGYLALDELLDLQRPQTGAHDELLFITIHQVYELWFKQILHELTRAQRVLEAGETAHALHTLRRVLTILKVAVAQVDVLETMTPRQFAGFRDRLAASSGFQSAQFRELEAVLGDRTDHAQPGVPGDRIGSAQSRPSLFDSFVAYLTTQGYGVPAEVAGRDVATRLEPSRALQDVIVVVYGDDQGAAQVCERLVDIDEGLQEWRYRHVKMVERTIGDQAGTGGSSGAGYLRSTLFRPMFPDLWAVRSRL